MTAFDLIVKNGLVFDGSGNPGFRADVAIDDDKIVEIGRSKLGQADRIIEAKGLVVAPGFIDMHQHSDHTLFKVPRCDSFIHQGVTTIGVGNCGLSLSPISDEHEKEVARFYEAFTFGPMSYSWRTFGEYLDRLEESEPGINIWPQVGHGTIRAAVMGFDARKPNHEETERMKGLLEESMRDGACALSTGGYPPTVWSETPEIIELAKIAKEYGGIYNTHLIRGTGLAGGFEEAVEIGEKASIPVEVAHWDGSGVSEARQRGVDLTYDAYPYHAGSGYFGDLLPFWMYEGGVDSMLDRMKDPNARDRLRKGEGYLFTPDWERAFIAYLPNEDSKQYEGKSIAVAARSQQKDPLRFLCDSLIENNGNGMIVNFDSRTEAYVSKTLRDPFQFVISDGWGFAADKSSDFGKPHPRCYGTFPRVLGWYVRECEVTSLQEAIRKMTWGPASKMGIGNRGLLRKGMQADMTIFDSRTIIDQATFDEPHQYPLGIEYVIVNGQVVIEHGQHTGVMAGNVMRRAS